MECVVELSLFSPLFFLWLYLLRFGDCSFVSINITVNVNGSVFLFVFSFLINNLFDGRLLEISQLIVITRPMKNNCIFLMNWTLNISTSLHWNLLFFYFIIIFFFNLIYFDSPLLNGIMGLYCMMWCGNVSEFN